MLSKSPLSLILHGGVLQLARQTAAESSSRGGQRLPGDSRLKPEVLSHAREVLLFLLLAEQTQVTQKTCVRAEGETQSLALTTADTVLVPDLLLSSWSQ